MHNLLINNDKYDTCVYEFQSGKTMNRPDKNSIPPVRIAHNFRDLGGYEAADGRRIINRQVFRSSSLNDLNEKQLAYLKQLNIKLVCDFRILDEVDKKPDILPDDGSIEHLHLPVTHGKYNTSVVAEKIKSGDTKWLNDEYMIEGYRNNLDHFADVWGTVIKRLADPDSRPLVFHCTAGKDRAGTCAALILLALGIPEKTVIYDYELSNLFLKEWLSEVEENIIKIGIKLNQIRPFLFASRVYIESLIDHINEKYGSAEKYLTAYAGVSKTTLDLLREDLLQRFICSKPCVKTSR